MVKIYVITYITQNRSSVDVETSVASNKEDCLKIITKIINDTVEAERHRLEKIHKGQSSLGRVMESMDDLKTKLLGEVDYFRDVSLHTDDEHYIELLEKDDNEFIIITKKRLADI